MIWKYIKADNFFRDYLPHVKSHKHKIRGKNGRGNPASFSDTEKKEIKKTLRKLFSDIA
jgi:hypothetical protein